MCMLLIHRHLHHLGHPKVQFYTIQLLLRLPDEAYYIANVTIGWLSPLNQATYHMHNFGYDKLPRLWQSYCIFIGLSVILYFASIRAAKRYNFSFTGTEG